jgi:uncharacterized membrane protein
MSQDSSDDSPEPVITGWLQTQLSGNVDLAQAHRREGRRVLGQMLAYHGVNARIAAGEPTGYYKTTKLQPDGTRITAWHNAGHNVLRIDAPRVVREDKPPQTQMREVSPWIGASERPGPPRLHHEDQEPVIPPLKERTIEWEDEEEETFDTPDTRIVGYCNSDDGTRAVMWLVGRESEEVIDLAETGGLSSTMAFDISDDGDTVVGSGGDHGWLWTPGEGMAALPAAPNALGGAAYGVSEDGRFIIGTGLFDEEHATTRNWVYDATTSTYEILPGGAFDGEVRISPNALWACGGDNVWNRPDFDTPWDLYAKIPPPGTTSETAPAPDFAFPPPDQEDTSAVTDIANDGTACGYSGHWEVDVFTADTIDGGTEEWWQHAVPLANPMFRWSPEGGMSQVGGAGGATHQIAGDTEDKAFVADNNNGIKGVLVFIDGVTGTPYYTRGIYVGFTPFGFKVGDGSEDYGNNTGALGISDDGDIVVGFTRDGDGNDTPVLWDRVLGLRELPTIGNGTGVANSVTTKAGLLDPDDADLY